jgi:hypothetical protein
MACLKPKLLFFYLIILKLIYRTEFLPLSLLRIGVARCWSAIPFLGGKTSYFRALRIQVDRKVPDLTADNIPVRLKLKMVKKAKI